MKKIALVIEDYQRSGLFRTRLMEEQEVGSFSVLFTEEQTRKYLQGEGLLFVLAPKENEDYKEIGRSKLSSLSIRELARKFPGVDVAISRPRRNPVFFGNGSWVDLLEKIFPENTIEIE